MWPPWVSHHVGVDAARRAVTVKCAWLPVAGDSTRRTYRCTWCSICICDSRLYYSNRSHLKPSSKVTILLSIAYRAAVRPAVLLFGAHTFRSNSRRSRCGQ